MPRIELSVKIDAPIAHVYEIAKDVESFPQFMADLQSLKLLERNQAWDFTPEFIKIDRELLGHQWLNELKKVITIFIEVAPTPTNGKSHLEKVLTPHHSV